MGETPFSWQQLPRLITKLLLSLRLFWAHRIGLIPGSFMHRHGPTLLHAGEFRWQDQAAFL
ncbi:hypothetical protein CHELA20_52297 [Hyphomicrobiales bacterium]|nr:hypothetical protein CHELA41_22624 [Hyphomicrobiales bacterium]CAH1681468.1 hypothetical protein CHELA20_52297 [Hyphomicrobiales bacterium]